MFEIGWTELLVIAVVALVVFPTKDLPRLFRTVGQWVGKMRRMAGDFQSQFNSALREAEREADLLDTQESLKKLNPVSDIKSALNPVRAIGDEIKRQVTAPIPPTQALKAPPPGAVAVPNAPPMLPKPATPEPSEDDSSLIDDLAGLGEGLDKGAAAKPAEALKPPAVSEPPKSLVNPEPAKATAEAATPAAAKTKRKALAPKVAAVGQEAPAAEDTRPAKTSPKRKIAAATSASVAEEAPAADKPKRVRKPKADKPDQKTPGGEA